MQLENKVAIVTGASLGIGRAIAIAFAEEGAAVTVDYRAIQMRLKRWSNGSRTPEAKG